MEEWSFQVEDHLTKLDYLVTQWPHICIPQSPKIPHFLPALGPMYITCYALPHTSAYQISKESTMFSESRLNTNLLRFHASYRMCSLRIAKFQPKLPFFVCSRGPETCRKNKKYFTLYYVTPYTNLHTNFQKNPSMFAERRLNTNLLPFHAKTASKWKKICVLQSFN